MNNAVRCLLAVCLFAGVVVENLPAAEPEPNPVQFESTDWPWWRGPARNGIAASDQTPPLHWSADENVVWKSPVPGRGHGSPTVVGNHVYLATADEQADRQLVLCFDRRTGKELWQTVVHDGGIERKGNKKSSQASSTIACDGERLFINFVNRGAAYTTALNLEGKILWQTKITDYLVHQGYGSSPAIYDALVIVTADNKGEGGGAIAAMNRASGEIVWRHGRPATPNYPSPVILNVAGRDQVLLTGCDLVASFAPLTGEKLWEVAGATTECVTSTVTDGTIILTSGGYPKNHMSAVRADGSGEVVWENNVRIYVPSMLIHEGTLYGVTDAGVAMCWEAATGKELWKGRLGGTFSASPVMVGEYLFATDEAGETSVFKADPANFELVAKNQLGTEVFATPTFCGNRIYMRVAEQQGDRRQEMLYCIGD
ncbi:MAG: PQQ-binding-like beta-propeller repeat protein [Planctomycetota bacterium]|nr:PQQ-binding-like beta-propeller repeat protein [Planctomycetota bacterium]MDA1214015.1 PQQ-binding-like beta-propeller repeat protein [Planctomycetota bacterium]